MARSGEFHFGTISTRDMSDVGLFHHNQVVSQTLANAAVERGNRKAAMFHIKTAAHNASLLAEKSRTAKKTKAETGYGHRQPIITQYGMSMN